MDGFFDPSNALLCDEMSKDLWFDDENTNTPEINDGDIQSKSQPLIHPSDESDDENYVSILERENDYLPKHDYLNRLRCADSDFASRRDAFDWISKAHCYYSFGPLSLCLAVNYLDRFFSLSELPRDKAWTVQLLAVACLSIAAKIEETSLPPSLELQVGEPKYVFEAKIIQRMELLVLDTLKWKMNAVTPCSLLHYSLKILSNPLSVTHKFLFSTTKVVNRSMQLILCTIKGIEYLEFKPSEIAAAVALSVSAEFQAVDLDNASSFFTHLDKGRVLKCVEMIKEVTKNGGMQQGVPQSPIGVLDAGCFSFTSSIASQITPTSTTMMTTTSETKRMKLDPTSTIDS